VHGSRHAHTTGAADLYGTGQAADAGIVGRTHVDTCIGIVQQHVVGVRADLVVDDAAGIGNTGGNAAAAAAGGRKRADAGGAVAVDAHVVGADQLHAIQLRVIGCGQVVE